jgi:hypothetical protein
MAMSSGGGLEETGVVFHIQWISEGQEQAESAKQAIDGMTDSQKRHEITMREGLMATRHFVSGVMALTMVALENTGATKEQIKMFQALHTVVMAVITIMMALRVVMAATPGVGVATSAMGMFMHEGGYGYNRMQVIDTRERVIPAHQVSNNYGGSINIEHVSIQGGSGPQMWNQLTEELESQVQRGWRPPDIP